MSGKTDIAWVRNPDGTPGMALDIVTGCIWTSAGCDNCWAARLAATRLHKHPLYEGLAAQDAVSNKFHWVRGARFNESELDKPKHWRKPRRILLAPRGDLCHKLISRAALFGILQMIADSPRHTFMILSKRPLRLRDVLRDWHYDHTADLTNLWIGTTVELNPYRGRIHTLAQCPAALRFVSYEPALGHIDWSTALRGRRIHWGIIGCEQGPYHSVGRLFGEPSVSNPPPDVYAEWYAMIRETITVWRKLGLQIFVKQLPIDGRVSHNPLEWPEDLRLREIPDTESNRHDASEKRWNVGRVRKTCTGESGAE